MSDLLYKELRLAAHPSLYIFMFMGALVLIPAYPYGVVFFFGCLGLFQTLMFGRETKDVFYTALLPRPKGDVVKGKILLAAFLQTGQLVLSLPFAFLRTLYLPDGNPVGMEPNAAWYGCGLLIYGVFNLVFFTQFYKTAYKAGVAFIIALIPTTLGIAAIETAVHIPGLAWLDGTDGASLLRQVPILLAGAVLYAASNVLTYRISVKRFQRVDL
ncbi:MAG: ABC-2 transporter permease [Oscillospiraceae bacterium]|nr:ABC-2 transporter permease [Oscillospiraceae bacterium]